MSSLQMWFSGYIAGGIDVLFADVVCFLELDGRCRNRVFGKSIVRVEGKEGRFGAVCVAVEWDRK